MSLVAYSDSEEDTDETSKEKEVENQVTKPITQTSALKRKRSNEDGSQPPPRPFPSAPPPLPSGFTTLYASTVRSSTSDDPTLHSGRKRQIPHVEGNWPSFVYLEWLPSPQDLMSLEDMIASIAKEHAEVDGASTSASDEVRTSLRSELGVRLPLHVSLSTPLILTTTNKDTFKETLTQTITDTSISTFSTTPSSIRWVKNFDSTRHFLILTLSKPKQCELQDLLSLCNRTAANFRLPQLYTHVTEIKTESINVGVVAASSVDATDMTHERVTSSHDKFHISIAWSLTQIYTSRKLLDQLIEKLRHVTINFDSVYIKIGSQISSVPLRDTSAVSAAATDDHEDTQ